MSNIGSWWLAKITKLGGEKEIFSLIANRTQSSTRSVSGKLFFTNRRMLFVPHLIDYIVGGKKFELDLSKIEKVYKLLASKDRFGPVGFKDRLWIEYSNRHEFYVVKDLDAVITKLEAHLRVYT
ncbi:unnamed protein product [marine sediment metagenome]|uniref:GRAM domain-containing protein n=1 Tax=marine sediment metagenome TaxID=412755 RepID=X1QYK4_9ZZZZ